MKKRFTEEQIIGFLREADAGIPVKYRLSNSPVCLPDVIIGLYFGKQLSSITLRDMILAKGYEELIFYTNKNRERSMKLRNC